MYRKMVKTKTLMGFSICALLLGKLMVAAITQNPRRNLKAVLSCYHINGSRGIQTPIGTKQPCDVYCIQGSELSKKCGDCCSHDTTTVVPPTTTVLKNSSEPAEQPPTGKPIERKATHLSGGAIAGIVCASLITIVIVAAFLWWWTKKCKERREPREDVQLNAVHIDEIQKQDLKEKIVRAKTKNEEVKKTLLEKSRAFRDQPEDHD